MMMLKSEKVVVEAPMSFLGSAKRIWKLTNVKNIFLKIALGIIALVLLSVTWFVIVFWYLFFGLLLVPYRLIRRSSRRSKRDKLRHQEVLEAINTRKEL